MGKERERKKVSEIDRQKKRERDREIYTHIYREKEIYER